MRKLILLALAVLVTACGNIPAERVLQAVEFGPDECGDAKISGNLTVGGNPIASTDIHVDIDKSKPTYTDSAGNPQPCP